MQLRCPLPVPASRRRRYQLCLFCYDRLKTEFSNRCPNCREEYDSDFQAGLRRRQERVAQLQREAAAAREATKASAAASAAERGPGGRHAPPPPRAAAAAARSPRRDLHIEQEQLWPSLGAAAQAAQQPQPQATPHAPRSEARRVASPLQLPRILPQPLAAAADTSESSSTSSSADTTANTPQSPVSSVVAFRAGPPTAKAAAAAAVQGRCAVVLQRGGCGLGADVSASAGRCAPLNALGADGRACLRGAVHAAQRLLCAPASVLHLPPVGSHHLIAAHLCARLQPDPEGASLAASLQEAVRAGSLSVKQAAASLASYLRQRQQQAAALAGSAASSPGHSCRQPSSAGSSGALGGAGLSPFTLSGSEVRGTAAVRPCCWAGGRGGAEPCWAERHAC